MSYLLLFFYIAITSICYIPHITEARTNEHSSSRTKPIFTGKWAIELEYEVTLNDVCPADYYYLNPKYKQVFKNKNAFADYVVTQTRRGRNCKCEIRFDESTTELPIEYTDFIKPLPTISVTAMCDDDCGYNSMLASPIYKCPDQTVIDTGPGKGCYPIDKNHCVGDVVGRNLDTSIPLLKEQGHVGIVLHGVSENDEEQPIPAVIEILNEAFVLQINTLDNFKKRVSSGYWGEKYGTEEYPKMSIKQIGSMYDKLLELLEKVVDEDCPIFYTRTWKWSPGGYKKVYTYNMVTGDFSDSLILQPIKFRCDTFVNYIYEKGAGIKLNTGPIITPQILYDNLKNFRKYGWQKYSILSNVKFTKQSETDVKKMETKITEYFSGDDSIDIDKLTYEYIKKEKVTNDRKVHFFIKLLKHFKGNSDTTFYLFDLLDELNILPFTDEIISFYQNENQSDIKERIYYLLQAATQFETKKETEKLNQNDINNMIKIQNFLKSIDPVRMKLRKKHHIQKNVKNLKKLLISEHNKLALAREHGEFACK